MGRRLAQKVSEHIYLARREVASVGTVACALQGFSEVGIGKYPATQGCHRNFRPARGEIVSGQISFRGPAVGLNDDSVLCAHGGFYTLNFSRMVSISSGRMLTPVSCLAMAAKRRDICMPEVSIFSLGARRLRPQTQAM